MASTTQEEKGTAPEGTAEAAPEKPAAPAGPAADSKPEEEGGVLECSKCDENCWRAGWFLQPEEGETERKSLCDDCFLICTAIKGADRCLLGKIKIIPKKVKKPKAAKRGAKAKH